MAPLLSADPADAQVLAAYPKDWYTVRLENAATDPTGLDPTKKGTGRMAVCNLIIEVGEYADRRVFPPYRVLCAGNKEDGSPHNLSRYFQLVNATRIEWKHTACGYIGGAGVEIKEDKERHKWLCPYCGTGDPSFEANTDHFWGKRIRVLLDQEKGLNSDEMVNNVARVATLP